MDSIKIVRKNILEYLKFLEKPRDEFSGQPVCPYVSKEVKDDSMLIDTFYPQEEDFIEKIKEFDKSDYRTATYARMTEDRNFQKGFKVYPLTKESVLYEKYINEKLRKNGFEDLKTICFSSKDSLEVEGFNPRSKSPYFLVTITYRKHLDDAHTSIKKTDYFSKLPFEYEKFLRSGEGDL